MKRTRSGLWVPEAPTVITPSRLRLSVHPRDELGVINPARGWGGRGAAYSTVNPTAPGGGVDETFPELPSLTLRQDVTWSSVSQSSPWNNDDIVEGSIVSFGGDSNVLAIRYPAGWLSGDAPFRQEFDLPSGQKHIAVGNTIGLSSNYYGDESSTNKSYFDWIHDNPCVFLSMECSGSGPVTLTGRIQNVPDAREYLDPNVGDGTFSRGVLHNVQKEIITNTPGVANGIYKVWLDHVLIISYSDVLFSGGGQANDLQNFSINNTYGGNGGAWNVPADQYMYFGRTKVWSAAA